ncbi:hypothetical protein A2U01_0059434, partial [Trifolium medium]|nr:hypothetical protein [Trifolium medium]
MLLHAQQDAPTSGCFTPNHTRFRDGALTRVSVKNGDDLHIFI